MTRALCTLLVAIAISLVASPAEAQVDTESWLVVEPFKLNTLKTSDLDVLDIAFATGVVKDARLKAEAIVTEAEKTVLRHELQHEVKTYICGVGTTAKSRSPSLEKSTQRPYTPRAVPSGKKINDTTDRTIPATRLQGRRW